MYYRKDIFQQKKNLKPFDITALVPGSKKRRRANLTSDKRYAYQIDYLNEEGSSYGLALLLEDHSKVYQYERYIERKTFNVLQMDQLPDKIKQIAGFIKPVVKFNFVQNCKINLGDTSQCELFKNLKGLVNAYEKTLTDTTFKNVYQSILEQQNSAGLVIHELEDFSDAINNSAIENEETATKRARILNPNLSVITDLNRQIDQGYGGADEVADEDTYMSDN